MSYGSMRQWSNGSLITCLSDLFRLMDYHCLVQFLEALWHLFVDWSLPCCSGVRPFGVSLLVAGFDEERPYLYQCDPSVCVRVFICLSVCVCVVRVKCDCTHRVLTLHGKLQPWARTILITRHSWKGGYSRPLNLPFPLPLSSSPFFTLLSPLSPSPLLLSRVFFALMVPSVIHRYNEELGIEDAVDTAISTLKVCYPNCMLVFSKNIHVYIFIYIRKPVHYSLWKIHMYM